MDAGQVAGLIVIIYLAGLLVTGMVCAFGAEAFYWDTERAVQTSFLWPVIILVLIVLSPFLLAGWLGRIYREHKEK